LHYFTHLINAAKQDLEGSLFICLYLLHRCQNQSLFRTDVFLLICRSKV